MKSTITLGLTLSVLTLGSLGAAPQAYAASYIFEYANHSGAICRNYLPEDATKIGYARLGIISYKESQTYVICPLTWHPGNDYNNGAYVKVRIEHTGDIYVEKTTECTAYSLDYNGNPLASETQSWTGTGSYTLDFNALVGDGKSTHAGFYSVLCSIPGNTRGTIHGITLSWDNRVD